MNEPVRQLIYVFEGFRLDAQRRVLIGVDGQPVTLTPRLFDTLLYFVERPGQLLRKAQLLDDLWPNVVVEEHNLNKTVSELRRVLKEKPGEHKFIVTKPGRGYRFVAHIAIAGQMPGESQDARRGLTPIEGNANDSRLMASAGTPVMRRLRSAMVVGLLAIVGLGIGFAIVNDGAFGPRPPDLRLSPWSSEKGGQKGAVWSPDSRQAAFAARRSASEPYQLYVRDVDNPTPRAIASLTDPELAVPVQWTLDDRILFLDRLGLYAVSPVSAQPVLIRNIEFDYGLYGPTAGRVMDVTRSGSMIAALGRTDDGKIGVFTASLPDGALARYEPDPFATQQGNNSPVLRFSPDGKQLLLWRNAARGEEEAWLLPIPPDPKRPPYRVLEKMPVLGTPDFSWLPDNRHVVVSAGRGPARALHVADTGSGRVRPLSIGALGSSGQIAPVVSPDGDKLIYTDVRFDFDVVTFDFQEGDVLPEIETDRAEQMPAWGGKADGLVYVTNRTGQQEIWLRQPGKPDGPLVRGRDFPAGMETQAFRGPTLSPDGRRVIYSHVEGPNVKSAYLWTSAVDGGAPERLTNERNASVRESPGSVSPDGAWYVYFTNDEKGVDTLRKVRTTGRAEPQTLIADGRSLVWLPVWSPDSQWILVPDQGILLAADGVEKRDLGINPAACAFHAAEPLLYCIQAARSDGKHPLVVLDFHGDIEREIGRLSPEHLPAAGFRPGLRLSLTPNGTGLTYAVNRSGESLFLLEGLAGVELP